MATNLNLPDMPTTPMNVDGVMPLEWQEYFRLLYSRVGGQVIQYNLDELIDIVNLYFDQLTANRIVATDSDKYLVSVENFDSWIAGTSNQITVTDDGDGTVTLSTPQNIDTDADVIFDTMTIDQINFTEAALSAGERELTWNADDGTLNVGLYNDVVLQVGQEIHYYAQNYSGVKINNGQPVMFAGTIGASGKLRFDLAEADPLIPVEYFMGLVTQDIEKNIFGYVTKFGLVRGINTTGTPVGETWNDGDLLYLSTTAGQLTKTPPTAPDPKILVAAVVYSHAIVGSLFVRPTFGDYLSSLHDVYITSIADNDILIWDNTNERWINTSDIVVDSITVNTAGYLNGDNVKLYFGSGNDASLYYDGTDYNIKTDEVAASDLLISCGSQKTMELQTTVYDDNQVSISNIRIPVANAPTERLYNHGIVGGVTYPVLGFAVGDYFYFDVQTYHSMKLNTILDNHMHFMTPTDGSGTPDRFQFKLDVIVAPIFGNWAVPTGSPFTWEHIIQADYTNLHVYDDVADIPASNSTVSTIYKCRLTRIAATQDEYGQEVYVEFTDCHYQKNTIGSRQEGVK